MIFSQEIHVVKGPGGSNSEESACDAGNLGSIPGSGRSPGEGNGYPLQYSCLENSMDRGAWQVTVCRVTKSQTQLSDFHFFHFSSIHLGKRLLLFTKNSYLKIFMLFVCAGRCKNLGSLKFFLRYTYNQRPACPKPPLLSQYLL